MGDFGQMGDFRLSVKSLMTVFSLTFSGLSATLDFRLYRTCRGVRVL